MGVNAGTAWTLINTYIEKNIWYMKNKCIYTIKPIKTNKHAIK